MQNPEGRRPRLSGPGRPADTDASLRSTCPRQVLVVVLVLRLWEYVGRAAVIGGHTLSRCIGGLSTPYAARTVPENAGGSSTTRQTTPLYTVNNCSSDQVTGTLAGGQVVFVEGGDEVVLSLQGIVHAQAAQTYFDIWVRDLSGYTGPSLATSAGGWVKLDSFKTDQNGDGWFRLRFRPQDLPARTYQLQVALNPSGNPGCTVAATAQWLTAFVAPAADSDDRDDWGRADGNGKSRGRHLGWCRGVGNPHCQRE